MSEEIPVRPIGREEIHKLETALLIGTLLRKDVLDEIRESEERITWIDSLAVAAGALARERAGMSVSEIADDLGRSEGTIRNHLGRRTKAGKLVRETYERIVREGFKLTLPEELVGKRYEELEEKVKELEKKAEELTRKYKEERDKREELEGRLSKIREELEEIRAQLTNVIKLLE